MRISDWSSDVCSSDLRFPVVLAARIVGDPRALADGDRRGAAAADPQGRRPARLGEQPGLVRAERAGAADRAPDPDLRALRPARPLRREVPQGGVDEREPAYPGE